MYTCYALLLLLLALFMYRPIHVSVLCYPMECNFRRYEKPEIAPHA